MDFDQDELRVTELLSILTNYKFPADTSVQVACSDKMAMRIGVFGATGSGKSCFISTLERAMRETTTCQQQNAGNEGTIILEPFLGLNEFGFQLIDTRGYFSYDVNDCCELEAILNGDILDGEVIARSGEADFEEYNSRLKNSDIDKMIHSVIIVVKGDDPRLANGTLKDNMTRMKEVMAERGHHPIVVVTHTDKLDKKQQEVALMQVIEALGCKFDDVSFVSNYTSADATRNWTTDYEVLSVLFNATVQAEEFVGDIFRRKSITLSEEYDVEVYWQREVGRFQCSSRTTFDALLQQVATKWNLDSTIVDGVYFKNYDGQIFGIYETVGTNTQVTLELIY